MFFIRLSRDRVSLRHRSCITGHGLEIRVVTTLTHDKEKSQDHIDDQMTSKEK